MQGAGSAKVRGEQAAPLEFTVVCSDPGVLVRRESSGGASREGYSLVGRKVFWLVGKKKCNNWVEVGFALDAAKDVWSKDVRLKAVADPKIRWADMCDMYDMLSRLWLQGVEFPGDWDPSPYGIDLVEVTDMGDSSIVPPRMIRSRVQCEPRQATDWAATLMLKQDGTIQAGGDVLFCPKNRKDRVRLRQWLRDVGDDIRKNRAKEGSASRVLLMADEWAMWSDVRALMDDMTKAGDETRTFDIATLPALKGEQVFPGKHDDKQDPPKKEGVK